VFQANDMIDRATEECVILVNQTIFAKVVRASGNKATKFNANIATVW